MSTRSKPPLRVVYISFEFPPQFGGGIGTYADVVTRGLVRRGHRVTVVTIGDGPFITREFRDGMEIVKIPHVRCSGPEHIRTLGYWKDYSDAVGDFLERFVEAEGADVIEFPDYRGEGVSYIARTKGRKRPVCAVRIHCPLSVIHRYNFHQPEMPVLEAWENEAILSADRLITPPGTQERVLREVLPKVGAMDEVPHPADPALLEHEPPDVPEQEEMIYVGRIEQRKGMEPLFGALPRFFDACPGARMVLIGGDTVRSPSEPSMKAYVQGLLPARYADRVVFLGRMGRDVLFPRIAAARACVFPSLFENGPYTCLEAMSLARPCIGSDNSGMLAMIEDGVSGLHCKAGDAAHLAEQMIRIYQMSAEERRRMGRAGRERVRSHFHADVVTERLETLFRRYAEEAGTAEIGPARPPTPAPAVTGAAAPKVAVVIPCFNHGEFVRETLESVRRQTHPNTEAVVVDDGSTDERTIAVMNELRAEGVRVIRRENGGLAAARNTGVRATDAEFFVPLDADDLIEPTFIEKLLAPLRADPALGYAYCWTRYFGAGKGIWECREYDPMLLPVSNLSTATAMIRRRAYDLAGGYSERMSHGMEDWNFWVSLLGVGYGGRVVPEPLFLYRKHSGGSMLSRTQANRHIPVRQIIENNLPLYWRHIENMLVQKDAMFFKEHMDGYRARCQVGELQRTVAALQDGAAPNGVVIPLDPLATTNTEPQVVVASREELERILNSRAWRTLGRMKSTMAYRALACLRFGPGWDQQDPAESPETRLARIKASRSYRMLQRLKRMGVYRWYAQRKYGHGWELDANPKQ